MLRDAISEIGRSDFWKRKPARRDNQRFALETALAGFDSKSSVLRDRSDLATDANLYPGCFALALQHADNISGASVAEHLAECLFMVGNAVFFDQMDEILRGASGERRLVEVGIGADEVGRSRVQIGEVAATAAADEYLLADFCGAFDYEDRAAALSRLNRTEESGGASADYDHVFGNSSAGHFTANLRLFPADFISED